MFSGSLGGVQLEILLLLDEFGNVVAEFLESLLLFGGFLEFIDLVGQLLAGLFERIDGRLLLIGRILGFVELFLGFLHLLGSLVQGLCGFGSDFGCLVLGFVGLLLHLALLFALLLKSFALFSLHFTSVLRLLFCLLKGVGCCLQILSCLSEILFGLFRIFLGAFGSFLGFLGRLLEFLRRFFQFRLHVGLAGLGTFFDFRQFLGNFLGLLGSDLRRRLHLLRGFL